MKVVNQETEWRQPEVRAIYDRWVQDHYGVIDMELLCSALYNAGARNAVTAMVTWQDLGGQINRMESRVVSSFNNMRSVLEALTAEDQCGLGGAHGITSEYFLYARRGKPAERRHTGTWHQWKRHYENGHPSHSSKPDHFYDLVEQVNDGPYVELFSRRHRLGWDVHGFDSANTATLESA